ncbi:MAG: hypothetical protein FJ267_12780, partial [Planctomycetes bacterium]|nr:hypothetical protein [Planctomycetota bacterium]
SGDVLAIYIEGFVGKATDPSPVFFPATNDAAPSFGHPYPVREDGTISLPIVGSVNLKGLTVGEAEEKVRKSYLHPKELLNPDNHRVQVNLQRPRQYRVLVIRQDSQNTPDLGSATGSLNIGMIRKGTGKVVSLPAYSNDVLNALAATDGLPGVDAENAVYVIRRRGARTGGAFDPRWPTDLNSNLLLKPRTEEVRPVIRGQSPRNDYGSGHSFAQSSTNPFEAFDIRSRSAESLHEPLRINRAEDSVVNAFDQSTPSRNVDHALWQKSGNRETDTVEPARAFSYGTPIHEDPAPQVWAPSATQSSFERYMPMTSTSRYPEPANMPGNAVEPANPYARPLPISSDSTSFGNGPPPGSYHSFDSHLHSSPTPIHVTPHQTESPNLAQPDSQSFDPQIPTLNQQHLPPTVLNGAMEGMPIETGHAGEQTDLGFGLLSDQQVIRIPIRLGPGETANIREEDIILHDGDIVFIESRETEVFDTAGLIGGGQFTL